MTYFNLAASAEMLYTDMPFHDRVKKIHDRGLSVEIWDWTKSDKDLDKIVATGANISSMTGYIRGNLIDDEEIQHFLLSAEKSLNVATSLNCPRLNFHGTGLDSKGLPVSPVILVTGKMWAKAALTLEKLAHLGEKYNKVFTLENLNLAVDHPGTPFARAEHTLALVQAVDSDYLRLNLDLYHAQIDEGNLTELCQKCLPWIGEIQVADVPGRCEPGTGEINYHFIAKALKTMGYRGTIAMEAWAKQDSDKAIDAFITTFTV